MKQLPILVLLLSVFFVAQPVYAQLEMDANGKVSVGTTSTFSDRQFNVRAASETGVYTESKLSGTNRRGVLADALGGSQTYGIWARAREGQVGAYGVYAYGSAIGTGSTSFGIKAVAGNADNLAYAVFAQESSSASTAYAGYFAGDVHITGDLNGGPPSDERLKEQITTLDGASVLDKLMKLRATSFRFKESAEYAPLRLKRGTQYGLLAQEMEAVFPEFVTEHAHPGVADEEGRATGNPITYKSISYIKLIPLLLAAIQEQQAEIDDLKQALGRR